MIHYYFQDADYQTLINGYDFGANHPPFTTVESKHYITKDNWDLWSSSKPNSDYVLATFNEFSTIQEFVDGKFETLTESEYLAHKSDLSTDHAAFIDKEWELCDLVLKEMGTELQKQLAEATINAVQGLQLQELFSKQTPMAFPALGGISLSIPITEYLGQNKSLGAAKLRLENTPVDLSIGFTQELKDKFIAIMDKQIAALHA